MKRKAKLTYKYILHSRHVNGLFSTEIKLQQNCKTFENILPH